MAVTYNYHASITWVFNVNAKKSKKKIFTEFMIFSVLGLLLSELLLWLFINQLHLNNMLAKIMTTVITTIFNFVTRKIFLEGKDI